MRRRLLKGGALLTALPLLLIGGAVLALSGDRLPVKSTAEVVPQDVVVFVQARDLAATLGKARGTESWKDLERSVLLTAVMSEMRRDLEGFEGMLKERAERLGLPAGLDTYMKFVGHDLGVGVRVNKDTGQPSMIMAYRIDTAALFKDLAVDSPVKLAKLLSERYFGGDGTAVATSYGGFDVYEAPSGGYYALLRDIFVASDAKDTVERAIDIANAGGMGSLGRSAKYAAEAAKLPGDALLSAYVDVERLRSPAFHEQVHSELSAAALASIDRAIKPFPALGLALTVPGGDLYQASLTASRGPAELLVDASSPAPSAIASPDQVLYLGLEDARGAVAGFCASDLCKRLAGSSWAKELEKIIDEPHRLGQLPIPADLPELPEGLSLRFERRFGTRLLGAALDAVFPGQIAISVGEPAADGPPIPRITAAVKLPPLLQIAEPIIHAVMAQEADGQAVVVRPAGNRELVTFQDVRYEWREDPKSESGGELVIAGVTPMASYVRLGDTLVISTDHDGLAAMAAKPAEALATPSAAFAHIPPGAWSVVRLQYDKLGTLFAGLGREGAELSKMLGQQGIETVTMANYVKDGFTTFETLSWTKLDPNASGLAAASYSMPAGPFKAWSMLPADTVLSYSFRLDPKSVLEMVRAYLPGESQRRDLEDGLRQASEMLGVNVEAELLPALASDICFGLAPQQAPEGAIAVPAITLTWSVANQDVVGKALASFIDQVVPKPQEGMTEEDLASMPKYVESMVGSVKLHVVEPPASEVAQTGGTVRPGYAFVGDTLVISSSDAALRVAAEGSGGYGGSAAFQRAAASVGGADAQIALMHVDLSGLATLIGQYAPLIAQAFPMAAPPGLEPPPFPEEGGDMDQWEKDYEAYHRKLQEHRVEASRDVAVKIRQGAETASRWVDYVASGAHMKDGLMVGRQVLKLKAGQ